MSREARSQTEEALGDEYFEPMTGSEVEEWMSDEPIAKEVKLAIPCGYCGALLRGRGTHYRSYVKGEDGDDSDGKRIVVEYLIDDAARDLHVVSSHDVPLD